MCQLSSEGKDANCCSWLSSHVHSSCGALPVFEGQLALLHSRLASVQGLHLQNWLQPWRTEKAALVPSSTCVSGSQQEPMYFSWGLLSRLLSLLGEGGAPSPPTRLCFTGCGYTAFSQERSIGTEAWEEKGRPGNLAGGRGPAGPPSSSSLWPAGSGLLWSQQSSPWLTGSLLAPSRVSGCCRVPESPVRLWQCSMCRAPGRLLYPPNCLDP